MSGPARGYDARHKSPRRSGVPPASVGLFRRETGGGLLTPKRFASRRSEVPPMPSDRQAWDYESVTPLGRAPRAGASFGEEEGDGPTAESAFHISESEQSTAGEKIKAKAAKKEKARDARGGVLKRGHGLTFAALFLFTVVLYLRPGELYPSALTASIAFYIGIFTLAVFFVSQLGLEGTLTARTREVNLILIFCLLGLVSIPLALDPRLAWETFSGVFIRCVIIFVVMVNAVRTTARLRGLVLVALAAAFCLSLVAVNDYRLGNLTVEGYRVGGVGEGMFGNPNDLALFLVTVAPLSAAMFFGSRSLVGKAVYALATLLLTAAVVVTFSRGGFLGLACAYTLIAWKLGRRNRAGVVLLVVAGAAALLAIAPGNYIQRLLSIFSPELDAVGSTGMRRQILFRSIWTAIVNPINGIGMGNFPLVSFRDLQSHNSYTQVAAEMGIPALVVYLMYIWTPLKGLRRIERETFEGRKRSRFFHLSVGVQSAMVGYTVSSFFGSVAYLWYVYYVVGYAVCLRRIYDSEEAQKTLSSSTATDEEGARVVDEGSAHGLQTVAGG